MSTEAGVEPGRLRVVFLAGAVGTAAELLLLGHTSSLWQLVPVALLGAGSLVAVATLVRATPVVVHTFRILMLACVVSGVAGVVLHYSGNAEFERELQPAAAGIELFHEAMTGATPVLAPGTMALLGVIGLLSVQRFRQTPLTR